MPHHSIPSTTESTTEFEVISRDEAIAQGRKQYFTGEPCVHGHIDTRFVAGKLCRECARLKSYRKYHSDPEGQRRRVSEYQKRTRSERSAADRRWRTENRERVFIHNLNAYAKVRGAAGRVEIEEWQELLERCGGRCLACGATENITADHVVPVADGGSNTIDNIQPLCMKCNQSKNRRTIDYRS